MDEPSNGYYLLASFSNLDAISEYPAENGEFVLGRLGRLGGSAI